MAYEHGTNQSVVSGCQCDPCAATRKEIRDLIVQASANEPQQPLVGYTHGTVSTYVSKGCRCTDCRHAMSEYSKAWRKRKGLCSSDQLRTCETCGNFYITKLNSKQRFCNPECVTSATSDRSRTCTRCQSTYTARDVHYSVDPPLCPSCLANTIDSGHRCPICEIPWWAPRNQHCCSSECQTLLDDKQQLVTANGGNHAL
jgi:hypothetical protein